MLQNVKNLSNKKQQIKSIVLKSVNIEYTRYDKETDTEYVNEFHCSFCSLCDRHIADEKKKKMKKFLSFFFLSNSMLDQ